MSPAKKIPTIHQVTTSPDACCLTFMAEHKARHLDAHPKWFAKTKKSKDDE
jgi:hypothetical protein